MDRGFKLYKGKHITVMYDDPTSNWKNMVVDHYDTEQYHNTFFFAFPSLYCDAPGIRYVYRHIPSDDNYMKNLLGMPNGEPIKFLDLQGYRKEFDRIIWYDLEHTGFSTYPWALNEPYIEDVDEVWTPWLENLAYYPEKYRYKYKFQPVRYYNGMPDLSCCDDPEWHFGFLGFFSEYRLSIIDYVSSHQTINWTDSSTGEIICKSHYKAWIARGSNLTESTTLVKTTKYLLDLPPKIFDRYSQNVIRINELLCSNINCISNSGSFNYFPEVITHIDILDPMEFTYYISNAYFNADKKDSSKLWKDMSWRDEDYEYYKLDCLQRYIKQYGSIWVK